MIKINTKDLCALIFANPKLKILKLLNITTKNHKINIPDNDCLEHLEIN